MKLLGHIHTFNDEDVIDRSLAAVAAQSRPLDGIVIVDNGSTDGTLRRSFPEKVSVIRNGKNLGTSGAVVAGLRFALENGYDWMWVLDADTVPRPDAMARLLARYESLPPGERERTWVLASLPIDAADDRLCYGLSFTTRGIRGARPREGETYYEFDAGIWTGTMFNLAAVRAIGFPNPDYVLDWGEFAYGYQGMRAGLKAFMDMESIVDHNISGPPGRHRTYGFGPFHLQLRDLPPIRCYYLVRNLLYFWLYEYHIRNGYTLSACFLQLVKFTANFALRPSTHFPHLVACMRGVGDGMLARMHRRF